MFSNRLLIALAIVWIAALLSIWVVGSQNLESSALLAGLTLSIVFSALSYCSEKRRVKGETLKALKEQLSEKILEERLVRFMED